MTTTLLIARHGNTFTADQTPTRVGQRTDLPLVPSGQVQARHIGRYLQEHGMKPDIIFTSTLKRTIEMGTLIEEVLGAKIPSERVEMLNEIDYGIDENKPEEDVIARIGAHAIKKWDEQAIVPDGWQVNPERIIKDWIALGQRCIKQHKGQTILAVTSNGIARFAPHLTGDFEAFAATHALKISTGGLCVLQKEESDVFWRVKAWNI